MMTACQNFVSLTLQLMFVTGCLSQKITLEFVSKSSLPCSGPATDLTFALPGDDLIFNAVLNATNVDRSKWPLNQIVLQATIFSSRAGGTTDVTICQVNIDQEGCHGSGAGCHCDRKDKGLYYVVFHLFADASMGSVSLKSRWLGTSSAVESVTLNFNVLGEPFLFYNWAMSEYLKNPLNWTYVYFGSSGRLDIYNLGYDSTVYMDFSGDQVDPVKYTNFNTDIKPYWNDHVGEDLTISFSDSCGRQGWFKLPVYDTEPKRICSTQTLRNYSQNEIEIVFSCANVTGRHTNLISYIAVDSFNRPGTRITYENASVTLTMPINNGTETEETVRFARYLEYDAVFVPAQSYTSPVLLEFHVNKSLSLTVRPGSVVTFSCTFRGHPNSTTRLMGPAFLGAFTVRNRALQFTLSDIQCQDAGTYLCQSWMGPVAPAENVHKSVDLHVQC